ncbi:MAG: carbohydrate ABC transporter permease [Treponema sp.]|jgi:ABC-type glycerol-3-phosphate transport system permease component|nr:carbohydrate ABC transporter permease [Treponema sp.]
MAKAKRIRDSSGDRLFVGVVTFITALILLLVMYPLVYVLSSSFSNGEAVMAGRVYLWPVDLSLDGYKMVFNDNSVSTGFRNSLGYMAVGTCINMVMTTLLAFPLSRRKLPGRNLIMFMVAFTMFFSGGLIPTFLIVEKLGMVDTLWAMVIPNAISTFNLIIMRTYFQNSLPEELFESAALDGCGNFRFLLRIALPLSTPILAVLVLYYAVAHWNSYFNALIYLRSSSNISLQLALRNILLANQLSGGGDSFGEMVKIGITVKYAVIVVSSLPVVILYPFIQKYFIKGIMVGAIKG